MRKGPSDLVSFSTRLYPSIPLAVSAALIRSIFSRLPCTSSRVAIRRGRSMPKLCGMSE